MTPSDTALAMAYLLPFVVSFLGAAVLTPGVRALARRAGLVARPSQDRWHERPTALLGGVAVYGGFLLGVLAAVSVARSGGPSGWPADATLALGMVIAATVMFFSGLADDKFRLSPTTKLILQSVAAAIVISFGVEYPLTPWPLANEVATFLWFLALTNALNLLDNMDGVAAGVGGIAALFLAATFFWNGSTFLGAICLAIAGGVLGFLPFNLPRASIFMGDSGSLLIGSMLAGLGAAYPHTAPASIVSVLFVPAAIVIIPILDTLLVTVARTLAGRPVSVGGRDHTTHRLVAMGLSERQVAVLLYAFAGCGGALALVLRGAPVEFGLSVGAVFLVGMLILAAYLGRMHSYSPCETPPPRVTWLVSDLLHKRRAFEVVLDLILFTVALHAAYLLRFDGAVPAAQLVVLQKSVALTVMAQLLAFGVFGVYRGHWQQLSLVDAHRLASATVVGSLVSAGLLAVAYPSTRPSASVIILNGLVAFLLTTSIRSSYRSLDFVHHTLRRGGQPVLIYGAGRAGELLVRELVTNPDLGMRPVGFLDDDPAKRGRLVYGYPVLGGLPDLAHQAARREVAKVIVCSRALGQDVLADVRARCVELGIGVLALQLQFTVLDGGSVGAEPAGTREEVLLRPIRAV